MGVGYKAKPNEPNKRGDMRGKRGKDKGKRQMYIPKYTDEQIAYWNETLDMVQAFLYEYLKTDKVQSFINSAYKTPNGANPPRFTPQELVDKGLEYFRFTLRHKRNMAVYGLALFLGIEVTYIMRMEQKPYEEFSYKNDVYKPIITTFKSLIGLFHEDMGTNKINPNFHIFVLKAMRSGFEEYMDLKVNTEPQGLSEEERMKLREQVKGFTETFTKKKPTDK